MLAPRQSRQGPSAAELLEQTKNLYVKTDILRHKKLGPGQPRLFVSHIEAEHPRLDNLPSPSGFFTPKPSAYNPLIGHPNSGSAFRRVSEPPRPPPVPPKSVHIREKSRRLADEVTVVSTPPLYPRRALLSLRSLPDCSIIGRLYGRDTEGSDRAQTLQRPVPKPRLSKLSPKSTTDLTPPTPLPRRRKTINMTNFSECHNDNENRAPFTDFSQVQRFSSPLRPDSLTLPCRKSITKSTPNLAMDPRPPHVSSIKRKILNAQGRSPTPLLKINQEPKMSQYDEEKDFLSAAMRDLEDSDDEDDEMPTTSFETPILVSASPPSASPSPTTNLLSPHSGTSGLTPSSPMSAGSGKFTKDMSTPTSHDSGVHPSDEENEITRRVKITKSVDDGFFDSSGERKTDEESDSSVFTSITNQPRREDVECSDSRSARPISDLERKARVMRWINGCEVATEL